MSRQKSKGKRRPVVNAIWVMVCVVAMLAVGVLAVRSSGPEKEKSGGEVTIVKSEVTSTARFYPVTVDKTRMEVLAVRASDGTVRTALNTCQICYSSGRGYYEQAGDELICQNCKNRFKVDEIERVKGGCNPVPITSAHKTENAATIVISKDFLVQNKGLFVHWKKQ